MYRERAKLNYTSKPTLFCRYQEVTEHVTRTLILYGWCLYHISFSDTHLRRQGSPATAGPFTTLHHPQHLFLFIMPHFSTKLLQFSPHSCINSRTPLSMSSPSTRRLSRIGYPRKAFWPQNSSGSTLIWVFLAMPAMCLINVLYRKPPFAMPWLPGSWGTSNTWRFPGCSEWWGLVI